MHFALSFVYSFSHSEYLEWKSFRIAINHARDKSEVCHPDFRTTHSVLLLLLLFISIVNGFLPGGSGTKIRYNTQIKHTTKIPNLAETKHSTQNYTNTKGHTTRNE
jgi:hypothetical protein